jgi:hypothetical protein
MMTMDAKRFFSAIRGSLFGGRLSQTRVSGIENLLIGAKAYVAGSDDRQLAYMLASCFHETAKRMVPVRETLASDDDAVITRLNAAYAAGRLPQVKMPYWKRDGEGKAWFGRGLIQITHRRNYQLMSVVTGYNLVRKPELALDPIVSVEILVRGMQEGCFTGYKLSDFFNERQCDWIGARKIVNGTDKAQEIAAHALAFYDALQQASIEPVAA